MEKLFNYKYLNKNHLKGFDLYKLLPRWLAPNLLTFAGFLLMVALVALLGFYDYNCNGPIRGGVQVIPDWVFTACAVFLFVAYNLDGMDGKQARRIGVAGPLGEMFDHGVDSYVVFFIPYAFLSVFGRDHEFTVSVFRGFLFVVSVSLNFYVSHFEKYNTGILYLPWGYDVSMWASSLLLLLPGLYGSQVYHSHFIGIKFVHILEGVVHATGLFTTLPIALYNVYQARKNRTSIYKSLLETARPVWLMLLLHSTVLVWVFMSPNSVLEYDPKAFVLLYGTHFSNICCRLIVAEMSKQRCDVITWMCWPLLASVAVSFYLPHLEISAMYALLVLSLAGHVHYGVCVVRQLCSHYKINCFTVPKSKRK